MKNTLSAHGIKLAILGAALATSAAAFAHEPGSGQRATDRSGHHACHFGHHDAHKAQHHGLHQHGKSRAAHGHARMHNIGMIVPGYGVVSRDFVQGMGLKDDQLKLIEEARKAGKALREGQREQFKAQRNKGVERFAAGIDPEQALKQAEERRTQMQNQRRELDQKWVAVWNALDSDQQARVGSYLQQRAEKAQARAEKRAEKQQERRDRQAAKGESA